MSGECFLLFVQYFLVASPFAWKLDDLVKLFNNPFGTGITNPNTVDLSKASFAMVSTSMFSQTSRVKTVVVLLS